MVTKVDVEVKAAVAVVETTVVAGVETTVDEGVETTVDEGEVTMVVEDEKEVVVIVLVLDPTFVSVSMHKLRRGRETNPSRWYQTS